MPAAATVSTATLRPHRKFCHALGCCCHVHQVLRPEQQLCYNNGQGATASRPAHDVLILVKAPHAIIPV
jgi:hypothetical protein